MSKWEKYRKTAVQEMRAYVCGEDLTGVSVAPGEIPKNGGKIAKDAEGSRWYISPEFIKANYLLAESDGLRMKYFVLKPSGDSAYAAASRNALKSYAESIETVNPVLAKELMEWRKQELKKGLEKI